MKAASVKEIKSALENLPASVLVDLCLRVVKFRNENKELATYVLFDEANEAAYVRSVHESLELLFADVHKTNPYYAKKTLRKIVRIANKFIRYSSQENTGVDILLFVAQQMRPFYLDMKKSTALENIYLGVIKKIKKLTSGLHEDLQYDYLRQLDKIETSK
jgi:hypothetical protein